MKAIYLLGVAGGIGLGLILACLLIRLGIFPTAAGNPLNAVLYGGSTLTIGTVLGLGTYSKRHRV
jgi:hypothetical protein